MQISKIALLMALTASGAIAAPLQGFEAALEQRGVDAATELDARGIHDLNDENSRLSRRSPGKPIRPAQIPATIPEDNRERLERQGGGRQYGMVEQKPKAKGKEPQYPTYGTKNEPSRVEKEKQKKKEKYGKNGK